ncbi:hypothetical protein ColLi_03451 [Colletotrichum liriopes]|uniref:Uncharacterized protein n=1 Tax=Colletotrichum liriopes TaxID=708192 RepID=A0AA37GGP6_9PEZI|nr:hypothetical protein ColLi_03451 [Colletotrichum liriopes]
MIPPIVESVVVSNIVSNYQTFKIRRQDFGKRENVFGVHHHVVALLLAVEKSPTYLEIFQSSEVLKRCKAS